MEIKGKYLKDGLTKEGLEEFLGYEINDFSVEPVISNGKEIGLSIMVHAEQQIEHININFELNE